MLKAPKDIAKNVAYRREILKLGTESQSAREEIILAASRDPIWFMDTFLWTLNPKDHVDSPQRPFITYPFQERGTIRINAAIGKHNLVMPKTRAVGGTYMVLATMFHRWRFKPLQTFLLTSQKEDRVDEYDNSDCLFYKLDHFLKCLPAWMRPPVDRVNMRLVNLENESVFNGETTNKDAGRGGRRTAVLADETAAMPNAEKIMNSLSQVSNTCIYLSTPQGAFGGFYNIHQLYLEKCPERIIRMHWTDHPVYALGIEWIDGKPTSPWYREQCLAAPGPRTIAQEIDIDFVAAGGPFYELQLLDRLLKETVREPAHVGELGFDAQGENPVWMAGGASRLLVWFPLAPSHLRPPVGEYIVACDISQGTGGTMSSQSTISVVNKATGEKVAEFKTAHMNPTMFGEYVVAVARWFHDATLIWGRQGPGGQFYKSVENCRYARFYRAKDKKPGFVESADSKLTLHSQYQDALHKGRFINRSKDAVNECRQFIFAAGTVEHSKAIQGDVDPEHKGKLHGDIVVSDALANVLLPIRASTDKPTLQSAPYGSFAWRMKQHEAIPDPFDWSTIDEFA